MRGVLTFKMSAEEVGGMTLSEFMDYMDVYSEIRKQEALLSRNILLNALYNSKRQKNDAFVELPWERQVEKAEKTAEEIKVERDFFFAEGG